MGTKTSMRIFALLLAVFLLLGAVPLYNLDLTIHGEEAHDTLPPESPLEQDEQGSGTGDDILEEDLPDSENGQEPETPEDSEELEETESSGEAEPENPEAAAEDSEIPAETPESEVAEEAGEAEILEDPEAPVTAAAPERVQYIITRIDFNSEDAFITAPVGTASDDLGLPEQLSVEAQLDSGEPFAAFADVEWVCGDYDSEQAGEYIFTAVLPQEWLLGDGIVTPQITVALVSPIRRLADSPFIVTYTIDGISYESGYTEFQNAWNFIRGLTGSAENIVLEMHDNGTVDPQSTSMTKELTIKGMGEKKTLSSTQEQITFTADVTLSNISLEPYVDSIAYVTIRAFGSDVTLDSTHVIGRLQAKTLYVADSSSMYIPEKGDNTYYISLSGYTPVTIPLTGESLTFLTGEEDNYEPSGTLIQFLGLLSDPDSASNQMIEQITLGSGYHHSMMAQWSVEPPTSYTIKIYAPPVMVTYVENGTHTTEYKDSFDDAVGLVNGLTDASHIIISLRKSGITSSNGALPNRACTITSDMYDYEDQPYTLGLGSGSAFTLNNDVILCDVGLAGDINCGTHTLSVLDEVNLNGATITGTGTLKIYGSTAIQSATLGEIVVDGNDSTPVLTATGDINCTSLSLASGAGIEANEIIIIDDFTMDGATSKANKITANTLSANNGIIEANEITISGDFTMNGATAKTNKITANTLSANGGRIEYSTIGTYNAPYILGINIDENNGITGILTISVPEDLVFDPNLVNRIIRVPNGHTVAYENITLYGEQFDSYALGLDTTDPSHDYYVLKPVVASVTFLGNTKKYTSLADAFEAIDHLNGVTTGNLPVLNLWASVPVTGGSIPSVSNPFILDGRKPSGGDDDTPNTLYSDTSSITLGTSVTFHDIQLGMSGSDYELNAGGNALTIGENVSFVLGNGGPPISPDITGSGSLTITGAEFSCGEISGFGDISFIGANEITLDKLIVSGRLSSTANTKLIFTSSNDTNANILFAQGHNPADIADSFAVTLDNVVPTSITHKLIRMHSEDKIPAYKTRFADKITLTGSYMYGSGTDRMPMILKPLKNPGEYGFDYFVLSEPVGQIVLTPSGLPYAYGDMITLTAALQTASGTPITDWTVESDAKVEFYYDFSEGEDGSITPSGNHADVPVLLDDSGTAELTMNYTDYKSKINVGDDGTLTLKIAAVFHNQPDDGGIIKTVTITITPKTLGVNVSSPLTGSYSKIYDGNTSLPVLPPEYWNGAITFSGVLTGDNGDNVVPGTVSAEFTNKNAGENKQVKFTGITLSGDDKDYYTLDTDYLTPLQSIATNWQIEKRPLGVTASGDLITKVYDGNTDATILPFTPTNVVEGDTVKIKPTNPTYASPNAGENINITCDGWDFDDTIPTETQGNYRLPESTVPLVGSITKKPLSFNASIRTGEYITKTYDGNNNCPNPEDQIAATVFAADLVGSETVAINAISATFEDINAGSDYTVTADFALENPTSLPASNYELTNPRKFLTSAGVINKAPAVTPDNIILQFRCVDIPTPGSEHLNGIRLDPQSPSPGMVSGSRTYTLVSVTDAPDSPSFFDDIPSPGPIVGEYLDYTVASHDTYAESEVKIKVESQNYEDVTATYIFRATNKTILNISGVSPPHGKVYDGQPVGAFIGSPVFTNRDDGTPVTDIGSGDVHYWYTDPDDNIVSGPADAGTYTLWAQIDPDNEYYMGTANLGTVIIERRGLVIKPKDKPEAGSDIFLGDPLPAWDTFADFEVVSTGAGSGLAGSETLASAYGGGSNPFDVDLTSIDLNDKDPQPVYISAPVIPDGAGWDYGKNYKITEYRSGTLTINGDIIEDGWIVFDPPAPNGDNGWYTSDITARPSDAEFSHISLSPDGPFGGEVWLTDESADGIEAELYLANNDTPTLVTSPYAFTYKLDKTDPVLASPRFDQTGEDFGIFYIEATDTYSGIAADSVAISFDGGAAYSAMHYDADDDIYSYVVRKSDVGDSFNCTITAKDVAGNPCELNVPDTYQFYEITGIKVTNEQTSEELTTGDLLLMEKDDIIALTAAIETTGPLPTDTLVFHWQLSDVDGNAPAYIDITGDNDNQAEITALLPVHPELAARSVLIVSAMGKEFKIDISFCSIVTPDAVLDDSSESPAAVTPDSMSGTVLVIEQLESVAANEMQDNMLSDMGELLSDYSDWNQERNSRWLDIWLMDSATGSRETLDGGELRIYLPDPAGSTDGKEYMIIHQQAPGALDNIDITKTATGISFPVDSLSPFAMIWRAADPDDPDNPGGGDPDDPNNPGGGDPDDPNNPGGGDPDDPNNPGTDPNKSDSKNNAKPSWQDRLNNGDGSGGALNSYDFWYQIRQAIKSSKSGDTVVAAVPTYINDCPSSVLTLLNGKAVALQITWRGKDITLYGKDISLPEPLPEYFLLKDLIALYGNSRPVSFRPGDLHNPETGGDDIMVIAPNGELRLTLPALPGIAESNPPVIFPGLLPTLPDIPALSGTIPANEPAAVQAGKWNMALAFVLLLLLVATSTILVREKHLYPATVSRIAMECVPAAVKPYAEPSVKSAAVAVPLRETFAIYGVQVKSKLVSKIAKSSAVKVTAPTRAARAVSAAAPVSKPVPTAATAKPTATRAAAPTRAAHAVSAAAPVSKPVPTAAAAKPTATRAAAPTQAAHAVSVAAPVSKPVPTAATAKPTATRAAAPTRAAHAVSVAAPVSKPVPTAAAAKPTATRAAAPTRAAHAVSVAAPAAKPVLRTPPPTPRARDATPASLPNRNATDSKLFTLIDRHRMLQQDFENGIITRQEYESQKRKLACCF